MSKPSRRSRRSSCPGSARRQVRLRQRCAPANRALLDGVIKAYGRRSCTSRSASRFDAGTLVRDGENGAARRRCSRWCGGLAPTPVKCGRGALRLGYFAQQALDLLSPDLTVWDQIRGLSARVPGRASEPPRAFQFSATMSTRRFARCRRRENTPGDGSHALDPPTSSCSTSPTNHLDLSTKDM